MDLRKVLKELLGLDSLPKGEELVGFSDEQLAEAKKVCREIASYAKDTRNVADLKAAVEAFEAISTEVTERTAKAAQEAKDIEELSSRITAESEQDGEGESDGDKDGEGDGDGNGEAEPEVATSVESKVEVTPEPAPVAASAPAAPAPVSAPVPDPSTSPTKTDEAPISLTAAGDVQGHSAGQPLKPGAVAKAMLAKANSISMSKSTGRYPVGHMEWEYPEDRFLNDQDSTSVNMAKVDKAITAAQNATYETLQRIVWEKDPERLEALTAAGGLCAPVNVRYELFTVGTTARPLRDALVRFGATRGGIRFNAPPTLANLRAAQSGSTAVNIYTETQDENSTGYPKGCIRVECGADTEVTVSAITLCMEVGNYSRMFNPEAFNAWWGLGRVQHARIADDAIWDRLDTLSTNVSAGEGLGATPDTLAQVERAAAQYRDRHRIDPSTPLRLVAPAFLRNLLRVDLARRMPGDSTLAVSDAEITRYFAVRNIAVTWVLDGQIAGGTSGYTQAAGALNPWPSTVDVALYIDGTFLFLDGGTLDFGTEIRDWDQIRQNDSGAFMETFENTAFVGPEALMLTLNICPDGSSGGTDEDAISCVTGS